jgi:hypothetical protein
MEPEKLTLVRVVAPHFVAGFLTDGTVQCAAPILKYMKGWGDDRARDYIKAQGWQASIIAEPSIVQHSESFEVKWPGGRKFFYYDDNAGRRAISGRMTSEQALAAALDYLKNRGAGLPARLPNC